MRSRIRRRRRMLEPSDQGWASALPFAALPASVRRMGVADRYQAEDERTDREPKRGDLLALPRAEHAAGAYGSRIGWR